MFARSKRKDDDDEILRKVGGVLSCEILVFFFLLVNGMYSLVCCAPITESSTVGVELRRAEELSTLENRCEVRKSQ